MAIPEDQTPILPSSEAPATDNNTPASSSLRRRMALVVVGLVLCAGVAVAVHSEGKLFHHDVAEPSTGVEAMRLDAVPTNMEAARAELEDESEEGEYRRCQKPLAHPPKMEGRLRKAKPAH